MIMLITEAPRGGRRPLVRPRVSKRAHPEPHGGGTSCLLRMRYWGEQAERAWSRCHWVHLCASGQQITGLTTPPLLPKPRR